MPPAVDLAVIAAAGRGTRLRPATRTVPKAFLPLIDRPALQLGVEEAASAGATEVIVVVDPGVEDMVSRHFDSPLPGLEGITVRAVVQEQPLGLGHAVYTARHAVAGRPFFLLLVDNPLPPGRSLLADVAAAAAGRSVVCLRRVGEELLDAYGFVAVAGDGGPVLEVTGAIEKPGRERAPSRLALIGRYLFTAEVFDVLGDLPPGHGGEIQLTDAIDLLGRAGRCRGFVAEFDLLDIGTPLGFAKAKAQLAVADPNWGEDYRAFLRDLLEGELGVS